MTGHTRHIMRDTQTYTRNRHSHLWCIQVHDVRVLNKAAVLCLNLYSTATRPRQAHRQCLLRLHHIKMHVRQFLQKLLTYPSAFPLPHSVQLILLLSLMHPRWTLLYVQLILSILFQIHISRASIGLKVLRRGDATVCRLSVRPSVTFRYRDHIRWNTWKIIYGRIA